MGFWQNEKIERQAAEIERLRAENEKLRGELREADAMLLKQARTIRELSNGRYGQ